MNTDAVKIRDMERDISLFFTPLFSTYLKVSLWALLSLVIIAANRIGWREFDASYRFPIQVILLVVSLEFINLTTNTLARFPRYFYVAARFRLWAGCVWVLVAVMSFTRVGWLPEPHILPEGRDSGLNLFMQIIVSIILGWSYVGYFGYPDVRLLVARARPYGPLEIADAIIKTVNSRNNQRTIDARNNEDNT